MFKKFWMTLYVNRLIKKHQKDGLWVITPFYMYDVIVGFKPSWLNGYDNRHVNGKMVTLYQNKYYNLIAIITAIVEVAKQNGSLGDVIKVGLVQKEIPFGNFLVDNNEFPVDLLVAEKRLRTVSIHLFQEMEKIKEESEIDYDYYVRHTRTIVNDIVECYSAFLAIASEKP